MKSKLGSEAHTTAQETIQTMKCAGKHRGSDTARSRRRHIWHPRDGLKPCLPPTEWNFDDLPAFNEQACFWWEYAREAFGHLAESFKKEHQELARNPGRSDIGDLITFDAKWPWLLQELAGSFPEHFPSRPFLSGNISKPCGWNHSFHRLCLRRFSLPRHGYSSRTIGSMLRTFEHLTPHGGSTFGVSVDWRFTDDQICEAFARELKRLRPKESPEPSRPLVPAHPKIGTSLVKFGPALQDLGIMRLHRAGVSASSLLSDYGLRGNSAESRDVPSVFRSVRKAKQTIKWLTETGTPTAVDISSSREFVRRMRIAVKNRR